MTFFSSLWCDTQRETQHRHVIRTEPMMVSHYTTRKKKPSGVLHVLLAYLFVWRRKPPWRLYVLRAYVLFEYHTTGKNEPSLLLHILRTYVLFEYHTTKKKGRFVRVSHYKKEWIVMTSVRITCLCFVLSITPHHDSTTYVDFWRTLIKRPTSTERPFAIPPRVAT